MRERRLRRQLLRRSLRILGLVANHTARSSTGIYGFSSDTSFSTPEIVGAAALVWAANPALTGRQVATILKRTASGHGTWTPGLGFGVLDAAAEVELAPTIAPAVPAAAKLLHRIR